MREIKFRAWFKVHKKMVYNLGFDDWSFKKTNETEECELPCVWNKDVVKEDVVNKEGNYEATLNFEILQYTGLKDKNGKEIYEGDICKNKNWKPNIFQVGFNRGGFCFYQNESDNYYHDCKYLDEFEIIGNIYENSDLL